MSGHPSYQPQSAFMRWMERRLPLGGLIYSSFVAYPTPRNLNYWWTFGGILAFMLGVQIATGAFQDSHAGDASHRAQNDDDVAALALFLCSPAARGLTGQAISVGVCSP